MKRSVGVTALCLVLAACGSSGSSSLPSSGPSQAGPQVTPLASTPPAASPEASAGASAAPPTPAPSNLSFTLCRTQATEPTCPLPPGDYRAPIHDAYTLAIEAAGWQEERASVPDEDESMTILSRTAAPEQRLTIDTGATSVLLDDAEMAELVAGTASFQSSAPVAARVGEAWGYQVDLAPTSAQEVSIDGADVYTLQAGHRYRLIALQYPMQEESGIKVIIVDAPTATFDAFVPLATRVLETVRFEAPS